MASKRLFEILDELNVLDIQNGTKNIAICPDIVGVDVKKNNGVVTVGVPRELAQELANAAFGGGTKKAILVIVDMPTYDKYK